MALRGISLLILAFVAGLAHAQVQVPPSADPGAIQQREMERERRQREDELRRERIERPLKPATPVPSPAPQPGEQLQFLVREIRFEPPSEILSPAELEELAAPYRGRTLRLADLRELVAKINALYKAKGVVTAQASLPAQDVTEGIVRIRLVEGRVGRIRLDGNKSTDADYITNRLTLKPSMLVDLSRLESDMVLFNRSNDAQLSAELKPGEELGQTDVFVSVAEPKRDDLRVTFENSGSPTTGELRLGAAYLRRSLTGRRDDLFLSTTAADGHWGKYLTYNVPVTTLGTRLSLGYFNDRTRLVHGLIAPLNISGEATALTASLRQPLVWRPSYQLDGIVSVKKRHTVNWIDTVQLNAADLYGGSLGLDLQVPDKSGYWVATAETHRGRNEPLGADARDYHMSRGSVRRTSALNADWTFVGNVNWQYAPIQLLPSSEQLLLGGDGTVRGYSTGLFAGDRGFFTNLEMHRSLPLPSASRWKASVFGFFDYGEVRPFRAPGNQRSTDVLASVGAGINFALSQDASGRIVFASPTRNTPEEPRGYRIHFQFVWLVL